MPFPYTFPFKFEDGGFLMALNDAQQTQLYNNVNALAKALPDLVKYLKLTYEQLAGPITADSYGHGWPGKFGKNDQGQDLTTVDGLSEMKQEIEQVMTGVATIIKAMKN